MQRIPAPAADVFRFFSDPRNLARLTPPWLRFRIHGETPPELAEGSRLEYRIRWGFVPIRWVTRITLWKPPSEFRDVQESGPYRLWHHVHRFREDAGGVEMRDRVEYALPFGPLGELVHALRVRRQLEEVFDYRRGAIREIFGIADDEAGRRGAGAPGP
jgi:hypothetical protein